MSQRMQTVLRQGFTLLVALIAVAWVVKVARDRGETEQWARLLLRGEREERIAAVGQLAESPPNKMGVAVPALLEALGDPDPEVRASAAWVLGVLYRDDRRGARVRLESPVASTVEALLPLVRDAEPSVRIAAIGSLGQLEPAKHPAVIPALIEAGRSDRPRVAAAGLDALVRVEGNDERIRAALLDVLRGPTPSEVQQAAARSLAVGWGSDPAVYRAALAAALAEPEPTAREALLNVVSQAERPPTEAVPELVRALEVDDPRARMTAVVALTRIGPPARPALPALFERLRADAPLLLPVATAIGRIAADDPQVLDDAVVVLAARLEDPAQDDLAGVAAALRLFGERASGTAPALLAAIRRTYEHPASASDPAQAPAPVLDLAEFRRYPLIQTLLAVAPGTPEAREATALVVDELAGLKPDAMTARPILELLMAMGPAAAEVAPTLARLFRDDPNLRYEVVRTLATVAPGSPENAALVELLMGQLGVDNPDRRAAISLLRELGRDAAPALPALRGLADTQTGRVGSQAQNAVEMIERALAAEPSPPAPAPSR